MVVAGTCDGKVDSAGFLISDRGLVVNGMLREKFGFAVPMRKPRYHAGFVSAVSRGQKVDWRKGLGPRKRIPLALVACSGASGVFIIHGAWGSGDTSRKV